jgi:DNA-binding HxlR family transcriptional regulator
VLDRIADKWAVLIISVLEQGPQRFNALGRQIKGLSQKVLSQTLKRLERDGFVARTVFPTVPITVEYALTPLGRSLSTTLNPLIAWSKVNCEAILMSQRSYDEAQQLAAAAIAGR